MALSIFYTSLVLVQEDQRCSPHPRGAAPTTPQKLKAVSSPKRKIFRSEARELSFRMQEDSCVTRRGGQQMVADCVSWGRCEPHSKSQSTANADGCAGVLKPAPYWRVRPWEAESRQPRPPERGSWGSRGVMPSSHPGPPARLSFRLGPAAPLGCGSALQPPAPCRRRESWAGGRSGRRRRRRQAAYTRLPVLHSELPEPAAAATAPAAAAPATAAAAT